MSGGAVDSVAGFGTQKVRRIMQRVQGLWRYRWVRHGVLPASFFTLAALLLTYPVVLHLSTHAAGAPYGDAFEAVRLIWWTKEALLHGMHPAYQPLLAYPDGFFSSVQWAAPMAHLAGLPFALLFPPLAAYNLTFLTASVLTGLAGYLLCWELTRKQPAALLGGLVITAFPTRMGHATAGHLTLVTNIWLLLYAWSLARLWRARSWRAGVLAGVFFTLTAATYPTNLAYELIPLTAVALVALVWRERQNWRDLARPLGGLLFTTVFGLLIFYGPLLVAYLEGTTVGLQGEGVIQYSADLLAFITPSPFNPVFSGLGLLPPWAWDVLGDNTIEASAYLGVVAIVLAGAALWYRRAIALPWLSVALVAGLLSLGPVLKIADQVVTVNAEDDITTHIVLPYSPYAMLPGLGMGRTPGRLNMLTGVALAALAALGFAALLERWSGLRQPVIQGGVTMALAGIVLVEYTLFFPFPVTEAPIPSYFSTLAERYASDEILPVLDLPADDFFVTRWLLYYQTAHHQPVLAGHVVRSTPANPAMLALVNAAALPPADALAPALSPQLSAAIIRASEARVVVVHRRFGDGEIMAEHLQSVLGPPVYTDAEVAIFEVADGPPPGEVALAVAGGWAVSDSDGARWMADDLTMSAYVPAAGEYCWVFEADGWLLDRWVKLDLGGQSESFYVPAGAAPHMWSSSGQPLEQGFQRAILRADPRTGAGCTLMPGEQDCRSALIATPRLISCDDRQARLADFGGRMRLVALNVAQEPTAIVVDTYWQALDTGRADYTLFVHLLDARGEGAAQWDGPISPPMLTSQWPQNGRGWQRAILDLSEAELPPGTYQLVLGLYAYPDLTRLPVTGDSPRAADGLFDVQEVLILPEE